MLEITRISVFKHDIKFNEKIKPIIKRFRGVFSIYELEFSVLIFVFYKLADLIIQIDGENIQQRKKPFIFIIFFIFFSVLVSNLAGMLPYGFAVTSNFFFILFLSFGLFLGINLIGFFRHKITFFELFLPSNTPIAISPLLAIIELISYVSRVLSLSIRLFANIMSGHALLEILNAIT
jgi:ATP synthase subunit 6